MVVQGIAMSGVRAAVKAAVGANGVSGVSGGGAVPENSVAPVISGSRFVTYTLSCTTGTWSNSPSSYAYQWKRDGSNIAAATAATYVLADADIGLEITCAVVATNGDGDGTAALANAIDPILKITGGTIADAGGYRIHSFTSSGDFIVSGGSLDVEYLIVAGGGGATRVTSGVPSSGAGAGGLLHNVGGSFLSLSSDTYAIVIGSGGAGGTSAGQVGTNGSNTTALGLTAIGGGASCANPTGSSSTWPGKNGGSGGGGVGFYAGAGGTGTIGQGNDGGDGVLNAVNTNRRGGGGGGAGAAGGDGTDGGNGGIGVAVEISGSSAYYAGGGSSGVYTGTTPSGGLGGGGGPSENGDANTGGGGGGASGANNGGAGGSGIVIVRYAL